MYWHQGWEQAPSLVKQCNRSWIRLNPDYEMVALDQYSFSEYIDFSCGVDIRRKDITLQKATNLLRLALLSKYGGVWADATVVCRRPLSEWLDDYYGSRFFAFRNPGQDRLLSSWFIAAEPENVLLKQWLKTYSEFYANNYFSNQDTVLGKLLLNYFQRRWCSDVGITLKWHSWFARKILRVYPYFIFHYSFSKLLLSDPECAALWNQVKPFPAEQPHRLQQFQISFNGIEDALREIVSRHTPMYKLDWRVDSSNSYWGAALRYLEEHT